MRKLVITGNGFDLAHKLPTSYRDFKIYLRKYHTQFYHAICRYISEKILWNSYETALGKLDYYLVQEENSRYYLSYGDDNWKDSAHHDFQFMIAQDLSFADDLSRYLKEWINQIDISARPIIPTNIFNTQCVFLNFNYTDTLEQIYGILPENILYIHGNARVDNNLIIGHHDLLSFQEENRIPAFNAIEECGVYMYDEEEDVRLTEAREIIRRYFKNTYKDTENILRCNRNFFNALSDVDEVFILGHSLSDIDMDYFREIKKKVLPFCKWYISYYEDDEIIRNSHFAEKLNIHNYQSIQMEELSTLKMNDTV